MPDSADIRDVIAAAERAAIAGDYALAQRHLREAAARQEAESGPAHPDLANTLNNLGVACERAGQLAEAEAAYRRAYRIAAGALAPDDPLVARSAGNLRDFCEALGRPFEEPEPAQVPSVEPVIVPAAPAVAAVQFPTPAPGAAADVLLVPAPPLPTAAVRSPPPVPHAAGPSFTLPVIVLLLAAAAGLWWWLGRDAPAEMPAAETTAPVTIQAEPPTAVPPAPVAQPGMAGPAPASNADADADEQASADARADVDAREADDAIPIPAPSGPAPAPSGMVAAASVCGSFSARGAEWQCEPIEATVPSGRSLVFYTRVRSARPMTIEHLWFRGDTLHQRVDLAIGANPGAGYRTYSRTTVGAGEWRVQLRANEVVLHEASFSVR
jgi:hypothetical protein